MMMKVQGTMRFPYVIKICTHNITLTAPYKMIKTRDTMKFAYDMTICIHNIILPASNKMIKAQERADLLALVYDVLL